MSEPARTVSSASPQRASPGSSANAIPARPSAPTAEDMRVWGDMMLIWALCAKPACRRARQCRGDALRCMPKLIHLLPEGVRAWLCGLGEAQEAGETFDQAVEARDRTDCGDALRDWHYAVSKSLGGKTALPIMWWRTGQTGEHP